MKITKTSFNGYLLALKSALCNLELPATYDTIVAQSARWLYGWFDGVAVFRLLFVRKVGLPTLASNARSSVDVAKKFYSFNLASQMTLTC